MLNYLPILIAYLLGGIPFGMIVAHFAGVGDIRTVGSGNIGATNVWRIAGAVPALFVFAGDIGKGVVALVIAIWFSNFVAAAPMAFNTFLVLCAMAAVLGHVFPIYLRFRGGKGVNTALGVMMVLLPIETAAALGIFAIVLIGTRWVSFGSMAAGLSLPATLLVRKLALHQEVAGIHIYLTVAIAVLVVWTHRENIKRIVAGTENRFSFSSKSKTENSNV